MPSREPSPTDGPLGAGLAAAAAAGPFFRLETTAAGAGWEPFDRASLATFGARTRSGLQERFGRPVEVRVAGSLAHLALAARLVSPTLVVAAGTGQVLRLADLRWRPDSPGPVPLALPSPSARPGGAADVLAAVAPILELAADVLTPGLAPGLLVGNLASAVAAAGRLAPATSAFAADVLGLLDAGEGGPVGFRRRSCCLYYRADPRAGLCEDCALAA